MARTRRAEAREVRRRARAARRRAVANRYPGQTPRVYGDAAYGSGEFLDHLARAGIANRCKTQPPVNVGGRFAKSLFDIDLDTGSHLPRRADRAVVESTTKIRVLTRVALGFPRGAHRHAQRRRYLPSPDLGAR